jgi:hypothetical protein
MNPENDSLISIVKVEEILISKIKSKKKYQSKNKNFINNEKKYKRINKIRGLLLISVNNEIKELIKRKKKVLIDGKSEIDLIENFKDLNYITIDNPPIYSFNNDFRTTFESKKYNEINDYLNFDFILNSMQNETRNIEKIKTKSNFHKKILCAEINQDKITNKVQFKVSNKEIKSKKTFSKELIEKRTFSKDFIDRTYSKDIIDKKNLSNFSGTSFNCSDIIADSLKNCTLLSTDKKIKLTELFLNKEEKAELNLKKSILSRRDLRG